MQARVFFEVLTKRAKLPSAEIMQEEIKMKKNQLLDRYVHSRRHTIQVNLIYLT